MNGFIMKRFVGVISAFMLLSCLFGCGSDEGQLTTVALDKNGKITNTIYEDFSEEDELKTVYNTFEKHKKSNSNNPFELK